MKYREALITVCEAARLMPENRPLTVALRVVERRIEKLRLKEEAAAQRRRQVDDQARIIREEARQFRIKLAQVALTHPAFVNARPSPERIRA